jgi:LmbE family N-acetylglucosaminyl deacetylase
MNERVVERAHHQTRSTSTVPGPLLSVWAHPDDETYLAGGLMAAAADAGTRVVCVSATAGELGTPEPAVWPPDRLGRLRRWETAAAMAVLGVREHRFLGLPDGGLAKVDVSHGIGIVEALIDEIEPSTIVTFAPHGMTFHPDHIAVSDWVTTAWRRSGRRARLLHAVPDADLFAAHAEDYERWGIFMSDERPVPVAAADQAARVHLAGCDLDRKLTALHAMASQTRSAVALMGAERYTAEVAVEGFVEVLA